VTKYVIFISPLPQNYPLRICWRIITPELEQYCYYILGSMRAANIPSSCQLSSVVVYEHASVGKASLSGGDFGHGSANGLHKMADLSMKKWRLERAQV
jgi:hypothetical protein